MADFVLSAALLALVFLALRAWRHHGCSGCSGCPHASGCKQHKNKKS